MAAAPWVVSDALWGRIEPLLPKVERRFRYPGRKRLPVRQALQGILFVLHTAIAWRHLPPELGFGGSRLGPHGDVTPRRHLSLLARVATLEAGRREDGGDCSRRNEERPSPARGS